jgi:hypothetical protein
MQYPKDMPAIGGAAEHAGEHEEHRQVAPLACSAPRFQGYCMSMSVDGMFRPLFEHLSPYCLSPLTSHVFRIVYVPMPPNASASDGFEHCPRFSR